MSSNCLVFHTSGEISSSPAAFLFFIFLSTESSSSRVNGPSLMSNCLLIIFVIGLCVTFDGFPSRFSKCCFHSFILSCWFVAFSLALAVVFLLHTSFIVCQAILDCLSSTESLILSIGFFLYILSVLLGICWLILFVPFFKNFLGICVRCVLLVPWEAVFTFACFSLTTKVSHGTLYLVLVFFGMYFAALSWCALTKFSYSSFGVSISVFSCCASNLFLNASTLTNTT